MKNISLEIVCRDNINLDSLKSLKKSLGIKINITGSKTITVENFPSSFQGCIIDFVNKKSKVKEAQVKS